MGHIKIKKSSWRTPVTTLSSYIPSYLKISLINKINSDNNVKTPNKGVVTEKGKRTNKGVVTEKGKRTNRRTIDNHYIATRGNTQLYKDTIASLGNIKNREDVKRYQRDVLGFTGDMVDGIWGKDTQAAFDAKNIFRNFALNGLTKEEMTLTPKVDIASVSNTPRFTFTSNYVLPSYLRLPLSYISDNFGFNYTLKPIFNFMDYVKSGDYMKNAFRASRTPNIFFDSPITTQNPYTIDWGNLT